MSAVSAYLSAIGSRGGRKSRRVLSRADAQQMVRVREARRAFKRFYAECFWSYDPQYRVTVDDIPWISEQLRKHGGASGWAIANTLCP